MSLEMGWSESWMSPPPSMTPEEPAPVIEKAVRRAKAKKAVKKAVKKAPARKAAKKR